MKRQNYPKGLRRLMHNLKKEDFQECFRLTCIIQNYNVTSYNLNKDWKTLETHNDPIDYIKYEWQNNPTFCNRFVEIVEKAIHEKQFNKDFLGYIK